MFAELKLPVEFFGVVDLKGKPLKAISMVYLDIRERLSQFLLSLDPDFFSSEPEIIIMDVDSGFGTTEKVRSLGMIFRNLAGNLVGKNADNSDIFVPIFKSGYSAAIASPVEQVKSAALGETFQFKVKTKENSFINLFRDHNLLED